MGLGRKIRLICTAQGDDPIQQVLVLVLVYYHRALQWFQSPVITWQDDGHCNADEEEGSEDNHCTLQGVKDGCREGGDTPLVSCLHPSVPKKRRTGCELG